MKFAINYSPQAAELVKTKAVEIDCFKTPDWDAMIAEASSLRPVAVHFNLVAGNGKAGKTDWDHIRECLEKSGSPFVNLHLEARLAQFPRSIVDAYDPTNNDKIFKLVVSDILEASQRFGVQRVIIENVPYRGAQGKVLRTSVEPAFIRKVLSETGCGLLFDLSHARISAHHLGIPEQDYIEQLPMERMREMHFTGLKWVDGKLTDHVEAQEQDWAALEWSLKKLESNAWARPWMLAFEYGGVGQAFELRSDQNIMAEQIPILYRMCQNLPSPVYAQKPIVPG